MPGTRRPLALLAAALLCWRADAASFPPEWRFRTLPAGRVSVHFPAQLETTARRAGALAGPILERLEARYGVRLRRVHLVVVDTSDDSNGFATPFPYPAVQILTAAPDGSDDFGNLDGWLRLVLTHELAHLVHLEQAHGPMGGLRKVFGRAPLLFPNSYTPTWMIEGLATYEETQGTAFGRGRNPDSRMVLRMAALEGRFAREDQAVIGLDDWPRGQASYLFGEAFLRDLEERYGAATLPELARTHSRRVIPFLDDFTSKEVTGASFHTRWREWASAGGDALRIEAEDRRSDGLTESQPLTRRGVRQTAPRFSPDGSLVAYTSATLDRYREIRLMRADGGGDRKLALRNGGTSLAWSPDGRTLFFDELEVHRLFRTLSDLRAVDVASGRVRRLTRGLRARDPDASPDGSTLVFVARLDGGSDLHLVSTDGSGLVRLTRSEPDTEWSGPRFSPDGRSIVASRWRAGGLLDLVLVDRETGALTPLTEDRAKDVEPAWLPDGSGVVFRSDRDGASNLYVLRLRDRALQRVTNVLGGAFAPDVAPDGRRLAFASYSARGYDLQLVDFDVARLAPAPPFVDPYPRSLEEPVPEPAALRPYRPLPAALPRFWLPYLASDESELRFGALTAGADPLLRHAYALEVRYGTTSRRAGAQGYYQYDRFRPTLAVGFEDTTAPGATLEQRRQELSLQASLPLRRRLRSSLDASLAWRRRRDSERGEMAAAPLDLGGLEAALAFSSARSYPYSISPTDGWRFRVAALREASAFGSDLSLTKLSADVRGYPRVGKGALALRLGFGATLGEPGFRRSYAVGGFADDSLRDVFRTSLTVLRGYPDRAFTGRSYLGANAELRLPLGHPQRGWHSLPAFLRHLHAAAFVDVGNAWNGPFVLGDLKTGLGAALGVDTNLGHAVPFTFTSGVAWGLAERGLTRYYFRAGLSF